jgi:hypothetical protein
MQMPRRAAGCRSARHRGGVRGGGGGRATALRDARLRADGLAQGPGERAAAPLSRRRAYGCGWSLCTGAAAPSIITPHHSPRSTDKIAAAHRLPACSQLHHNPSALGSSRPDPRNRYERKYHLRVMSMGDRDPDLAEIYLRF